MLSPKEKPHVCEVCARSPSRDGGRRRYWNGGGAGARRMLQLEAHSQFDEFTRVHERRGGDECQRIWRSFAGRERSVGWLVERGGVRKSSSGSQPGGHGFSHQAWVAGPLNRRAG